MMRRAAAMAAFVAALAIGAPAAAQVSPTVDFSKFPSADLAGIATELEAGNPHFQGINYILDPTLPKAKLAVTYLGDRRPIAPDEARMLHDIAAALPQLHAEAYVASYKDAYAFASAGRTWWLPVQAQVAAFFPKELKQGQAVDLYVITIGGVAKNGGRVEPVVLVEEFQAGAAP